jgi:hypothetical protein
VSPTRLTKPAAMEARLLDPVARLQDPDGFNAEAMRLAKSEGLTMSDAIEATRARLTEALRERESDALAAGDRVEPDRAELDRKVRAVMAETGETDYAKALDATLRRFEARTGKFVGEGAITVPEAESIAFREADPFDGDIDARRRLVNRARQLAQAEGISVDEALARLQREADGA